jgi:hypothetical protein
MMVRLLFYPLEVLLDLIGLMLVIAFWTWVLTVAWRVIRSARSRWSTRNG